jgi:hypothetical protein
MANTYYKIASVEIGAGGASTIDFTSIPQTYTDLCIKVSARTNVGQINSFLICQPNSATTNLSSKVLFGTSSTVGSGSYSVEQSIWTYVCGANATLNTFSNNEIYIANYSSTSANKSISVDGVNEHNSSGDPRQNFTAGLWSSTTAISSIKLYPTDNGFTPANFLQYSTAYLYGIVKQ